MSTVFKKFTDAGFKFLGKHLTKNNKIGSAAMALTLSTLAACAPFPQDGGYAPIKQQANYNTNDPRITINLASPAEESTINIDNPRALGLNCGPTTFKFHDDERRYGTLTSSVGIGSDKSLPIIAEMSKNPYRPNEIGFTYHWEQQLQNILKDPTTPEGKTMVALGALLMDIADHPANYVTPTSSLTADRITQPDRDTLMIEGPDGDNSVKIVFHGLNNPYTAGVDITGILRGETMPATGKRPTLGFNLTGQPLLGSECAFSQLDRLRPGFLANGDPNVTVGQQLDYLKKEAYYLAALTCYKADPTAPILTSDGFFHVRIKTSAGNPRGDVMRIEHNMLRMDRPDFDNVSGMSNQQLLTTFKQDMNDAATFMGWPSAFKSGLGRTLDHRATGGVKLRSNYAPSSNNPYNRGYTP